MNGFIDLISIQSDVTSYADDFRILVGVYSEAEVDALIAAIPGGVTDHGALSGLADDDHSQYYNAARLDAVAVKLTGDQTIAGAKTFSANMSVGGTLITSAATGNGFIFGEDGGNSRIFSSRAIIYQCNISTGQHYFHNQIGPSLSSGAVVTIGTPGSPTGASANLLNFIDQIGSVVASVNQYGLLTTINATLSSLLKFTGYTTGLLPVASAHAGAITYDTTLAKHVGSNGTIWNPLW